MTRAAIIMVLAALLPLTAYAQGTKPIADNVGFCWDASQMQRLVDYLERVETDPAAPPDVVAAISPHDDYLYAARVYYPLYRVLRARQVVIFGVTHSAVKRAIGDPQGVLILDDFADWPGLGRRVAVSPLREYIKARLDTSDYVVSDKAQGLEHSIEAVVPFLQHFNPGVQITPIMVTQMPVDRMNQVSDALSGVIADYVKANRLVPGKDIAFLISSDADHYGEDFDNSPYGEDAKAHAEATANDRRIAGKDLAGVVSPGKLEDFASEMKAVVWCGRYAIPFGLLTSEKIVSKVNGRQLTGRILRYSDSYTESVLPLRGTGMGTTAPASYKHWCGWLSAAFYLR